jgi:hypothetical protein
MNDNNVLATLNRAFIRVYRSFGQYLYEAYPTLDIGADTIRSLWQRQADDARRLGEYIGERQGSVVTGTFPIDYADLHFLNASGVVADWICQQRKLIEQLKADRAALGDRNDPGVAILDEIIDHERESLARLQSLAAPSDS